MRDPMTPRVLPWLLVFALAPACSFDDPVARGGSGSGGTSQEPAAATETDAEAEPDREPQQGVGHGGTGGALGWCGDGFVDATEQCDDGNAQPYDGCESDCSRSVGVVAVSAGGRHTCAISTFGEVKCWGDNTFGQLGYGTDVANVGLRETPYDFIGSVELGERAARVSAGTDHTCALGLSGSVYCWGRNDLGQLGYGHTDDLGDELGEAPVSIGPVDLAAAAVDVAAGSTSTCAAFEDGTVSCWGGGGAGELGLGGGFLGTVGAGLPPYERPRLAPFAALGITVEPGALAGGGGQHWCVSSAGAVRCWGLNSFGQLGYGDTDDVGIATTPAVAGDVVTNAMAVAVSVGARHTCAVTSQGGIRCWGRGTRGGLGYASEAHVGDDELPPDADVDFGGVATAVTVGDRFSCALTDSAEVRCWGDSEFGQLGLGSTSSIGDDESPAQGPGYRPVPLGVEITQIDAGDAHVCALGVDLQVRCWGSAADGRLGHAFGEHLGDDATDNLNPIPTFRPT